MSPRKKAAEPVELVSRDDDYLDRAILSMPVSTDDEADDSDIEPAEQKQVREAYTESLTEHKPAKALKTPSIEEDDEPERNEIPDSVITALKPQVEAILFLTGRALQLDELAEMLATTREAAEMAVGELIADYACRDGSALEIDDSDGYILQVREPYQHIVHRMLPLDLSTAALRTLSVVALKEPLLQTDLIILRGSGAYEHLHELVKKKLITKRRKGRSYLLYTSETFHAYFKLAADKSELAHLLADLVGPAVAPVSEIDAAEPPSLEEELIQPEET